MPPPSHACSPHNNELRVMKSHKVHGVVTRPSFVYGKTNSGHFNSYFKQAELGSINVKLADLTWSLIHVDDLADGYVKIVEAPSNTVGGLAFNFAHEAHYKNRVIAEKFGKFVNPNVTIKDDPSTEGLFPPFCQSSVIDSTFARDILHWTPRHAPMLEEVEVQYATYKAH